MALDGRREDVGQFCLAARKDLLSRFTQNVKSASAIPSNNSCHVLACSQHVDCGAEWDIFTRLVVKFKPRVRIPHSTWDGGHISLLACGYCNSRNAEKHQTHACTALHIHSLQLVNALRNGLTMASHVKPTETHVRGSWPVGSAEERRTCGAALAHRLRPNGSLPHIALHVATRCSRYITAALGCQRLTD